MSLNPQKFPGENVERLQLRLILVSGLCIWDATTEQFQHRYVENKLFQISRLEHILKVSSWIQMFSQTMAIIFNLFSRWLPGNKVVLLE